MATIRRNARPSWQVVPAPALCLGHADQLGAPGSVLAREIAAYLLLARDSAGTVRASIPAAIAARAVGNGRVVPSLQPPCLYHG
jgi:hypothetical protein